MARNSTIVDGQVAATATEICTGPSDDQGRPINATFTNVGGSPETLVLTVARNGGTARRLFRAVLAANEQLVIAGLLLNSTDSLKGATSNAESVDYVVAISERGQPFGISVYDVNGALKSGSGGVSGNLSITGDLTVSGGDIDAGASGTAGTVDIFPSTASKGKTQIAAAANAGDTTTTITNASFAQATTLTITDPLAAAAKIDPEQITIVTLTSAQLLALHSTPIEVLAAPGANKAHLILSVEARHAAGTAYAAIAAGDDIALKYTDGSGAQCFTSIETTGFLDQTGAEVRHYPGNTIGEVEPVANAAVVASLGGAITTGDFDVLLRIRSKIVATNFS